MRPGRACLIRRKQSATSAGTLMVVGFAEGVILLSARASRVTLTSRVILPAAPPANVTLMYKAVPYGRSARNHEVIISSVAGLLMALSLSAP
jgi:hypothetical protein